MPGLSREESSSWSRRLVACALLLALAAAGLLAASLIPFSWLEPRVDAWAVDGDARYFNAERHRQIIATARLGALFQIAAAALLWTFRRRLARRLSSLVQELRETAGELAGRLLDALRAESVLHLAVLVAIWGIGAVWRLLFLQTPMRGDEAYTYIAYVSQPLPVGMSYYSSPNNHLLHTVLAHLSCGLFGDAPWAIRLPALTAGILILPAAYLATRLVYGKHAALIAAALVATAPTLLEFATNARGYSLVTLAFLLLVALVAVLVEGPRPSLWMLFAGVAALGLYAVPTMLYPLASAGAWLVLQSRGRPGLRRGLAGTLLVTGCLTAVAYAPVWIVSGWRSLLHHPAIASRSWSDFFAALPARADALWSEWTRGLPLAAVVALSLGLVAGLLLHHRLTRFGTAGVHPLAALALGVGPLLLLQRVDPYSRVWLFILPMLCGLTAAGLLGLVEWRRPISERWVAAAAAALCLSSSLTLRPPHAFELSVETGTVIDGQAVAAYLEPRLRPGDQVVTTRFTGPPINYAFRRRGLPLEHLSADPASALRVWLLATESDDYAAALRSIDRVDLPETFDKAVLVERFGGYHGARLYLLEARAEQGGEPPNEPVAHSAPIAPGGRPFDH